MRRCLTALPVLLLSLAACTPAEDPAPTSSEPLATGEAAEITDEECTALRAAVDPLAIGAEDTQVDPAAATAAATALDAIPTTTTTGDLLASYLTDGLTLAGERGTVPGSLVSDVERLDRYCPAG